MGRVKNVWANEIDQFCCKVLRKNFSNLKIYEQDIREIGSHNLEPVDIISGGFPCQPFSHAGKRKGKEDDRYLWPEMLRVIKEVMPSWIVGENVAGLKSMENGKTLEGILIDLEDIGYQVETFLIPACSVGAWHRRDRIWIIANSTGNGITKQNRKGSSTKRGEFTFNDTEIRGQFKTIQPERLDDTQGIITHTNGVRRERGKKTRNIIKGGEKSAYKQFKRLHNITNGGLSYEAAVYRTPNGISRKLDSNRQGRIKALGNAIVPQVAYEIFKSIILAHELDN